MKKIVVIAIAAVMAVSSAFSQDKLLNEFFDSTDAFMSSHVVSGLVDYEAIRKDVGQINDLYAMVGKINLDDADEDTRKAFYINAYNIIVIHEVVRFYPLASPKDKDGFFDVAEHDVAGSRMTLNTLEYDALLVPYKDARIHFALACAAKSCPKLASFAYQPEELDQTLEIRSVMAVNDKNFIKEDKETKKILISEIFEWYKKDFESNGSSSMNFIRRYRTRAIPKDYSIGYYDYDWQLNEQ